MANDSKELNYIRFFIKDVLKKLQQLCDLLGNK